mmetsp:Transcript_8370/g.25102  ORF Transcript_8370/g.25102 Transcript_8370/m.25102 type:complete len:86 (+) Transcript_8370:1020-1277(+)
MVIPDGSSILPRHIVLYDVAEKENIEGMKRREDLRRIGQAVLTFVPYLFVQHCLVYTPGGPGLRPYSTASLFTSGLRNLLEATQS